MEIYKSIKAYYKRLVPSLTEEDWMAIEEKLTVQQLNKGDALVRNGEVCRQVSFVNKGLLRLYYLADGKEVCTGFVPENEYISEYASFLTRSPAAQNIDALENSEVINLSYESMQALYHSHPVFEIFGRRIAEKLFVMISFHHASLLLLAPKDRYLSVVTNQPYVIQRVPQYMIASFIGITPEQLSRIRKEQMR